MTAAGSGSDLALLHGWGINSTIWSEVASRLAPHFRVDSVDLPGYGAREVCTPYTLDTVTETVAANGRPRLSVCGWSLGGLVALRWALRYPGQVTKLILISTTPCYVNTAQWKGGIDASAFEQFERSVASEGNRMLQRFIALTTQGESGARELARRLAASAEPDSRVLAAGLKILRDTDMRTALGAISQPTLILHGALDAVVPVAAAYYLQKALPNAELEVVPGAGHAPHASAFDRVSRRIMEFCGKR